jgi:hypothetical protein
MNSILHAAIFIFVIFTFGDVGAGPPCGRVYHGPRCNRTFLITKDPVRRRSRAVLALGGSTSSRFRLDLAAGNIVTPPSVAQLVSKPCIIYELADNSILMIAISERALRQQEPSWPR